MLTDQDVATLLKHGLIRKSNFLKSMQMRGVSEEDHDRFQQEYEDLRIATQHLDEMQAERVKAAV